jgi:ribosomal protein S18 acetylase RimI-like enzyme
VKIVIEIKDQCDVETLLELNQYVHQWHVSNYPKIFKNNEADLRNYFCASLERPYTYHFVAYDNSDPIGFIQTQIIETNSSPFRLSQKMVYINIIVVKPAYHGTGVAQMLFDKVTELAKKNGITRMELDHWEGNARARAFFEKMGFKPYRHYLFKENE